MKQIFTLLACCICGTGFSQQQMTNSGNIQLHPGAQMTFFGNFANNGSVVDSGAMVTFGGNANQVISGVSAFTRFNRCTINNTAGVTLNQPVSITRTIAFTNGALTLNLHSLSIRSGAITAVTRTNGYVVSEQTNNSGRIIWNIGSTTGAHVFPFGTPSGAYIPFTLNLTSGVIDTVTLATYGTGANNLPLPSVPNPVLNLNDTLGNNNSANTVDRFWQISKTGPGGVATLTFTAAPSETGAITLLRAQRWSPTSQSWQSPLPGQTSGATTATVPNVSVFSPWTLSGNNSPLPVELLTFSATLNSDRKVDLNWVTASEINNDFFTVEKTADGNNFKEAGTMDGAGNSNGLLDYRMTDPEPYAGISYYRLKQTDFDGTFKYSQLVKIQLANEKNMDVRLFPNPATEKFFLAFSSATPVEIMMNISDIHGKTVDLQLLPAGITVHQSDISFLAPGLYTVRLTGEGHADVLKLIVQ